MKKKSAKHKRKEGGRKKGRGGNSVWHLALAIELHGTKTKPHAVFKILKPFYTLLDTLMYFYLYFLSVLSFPI